MRTLRESAYRPRACGRPGCSGRESLGGSAPLVKRPEEPSTLLPRPWLSWSTGLSVSSTRSLCAYTGKGNRWTSSPRMPMFDGFRSDPRFALHLKRIGHPVKLPRFGGRVDCVASVRLSSIVCPFVVKGRDRANTTRRSAAGLLALVENRHPLRRFSKLGGKAVDGSVLAVLRGRPWLFRGASASIGHRPLGPLWEEGGPGGRRKRIPPLCGDAPGCPTTDDRELGRADGRPGFDLTPPVMRPVPSGRRQLRARRG